MQKLNIPYVSVELGEIQTLGEILPEELNNLKNELSSIGLQLIHDQNSILTLKIKNTVIKFIKEIQEEGCLKLSDFISSKIGLNYTYIANFFSRNNEMTLQQYYLTQKIELVKEFIHYNKFNLSEISYKLNYSSPAHLSNQFKKITGISPSKFKNLHHSSLSQKDKVNFEEIPCSELNI